MAVETGAAAMPAETGVAVVAEIGDLLVASSVLSSDRRFVDRRGRLGRADRSVMVSPGRPWNTASRRPRHRKRSDSMDRFGERREALRRTLRASDHVGFLVTSPTNVRYLTGFTGDSSVLLVGLGSRDHRLRRPFHDADSSRNVPDSRPAFRPTGEEMVHAIAAG